MRCTESLGSVLDPWVACLDAAALDSRACCFSASLFRRSPKTSRAAFSGWRDDPLAEAPQISPSCVSKWRKRLRETGAPTPGQTGGHKPRTLVGERADWLRARVAVGPFSTRAWRRNLRRRASRPTDTLCGHFCTPGG
jgi:hypothetical protein